MPVELTTIEAVPLIRTGTYDLSTGSQTFAEEDLAAAAAAWATDPAVKNPRVKIASVESALGLDPAAHGGEPAFGYFDNLRVSDDGQTLLADAHVPPGVAGAMEWAYPSLSIEGTPRGWTSATGRSHELVVTAVALLGVHWPGVSTLEDFSAFLAEGPKIEKTDAPEEVLATMPRHARTGPHAGLDVDLIGRRFIDLVDGGGVTLPDGIENAWALWVTAIRVDDTGNLYVKAIDESSGRLFRADATVKGGEVTFGDLVEVIEQDVPVAAAGARAPVVLASWASRAESRAVRATQTTDEEAPGMTDEQRRTLAAAHGLDPETATVEQIMAAAAEAAQARVPEPAPEPAPPEPVVPEPVPEPVAASAAPTVTVSREVWEETNRRLQAVETDVQARSQAEQRVERDGMVTAALREGRIGPSERATWREQLDRAPEATAALLAALAPGRHAPTNAPDGGLGDQDLVAAGGDGGTGWFTFDNQGA